MLNRGEDVLHGVLNGTLHAHQSCTAHLQLAEVSLIAQAGDRAFPATGCVY